MAPSRQCRLTKQRQVILEELRAVTSHPTANELYLMVRRRLPRISLGTVYRNLDILSESGVIRKLELSGNLKRFDGITDNHYHVRCTACGRVEDVRVDPIPMIEEIADKLVDFEITNHRLEFFGLCPSCREAERRRRRRRADEPAGHDSGGIFQQIG